MARKAKVAAVIRRGPSKWVQISASDTLRDTFVHGAWFKGRIYEEKCALSPDGVLFLYFAHKNKLLNTSYTDSFTAVSRLPWLHALALWPSGTTYGGGGYFVGDREVVVSKLTPIHPDHPGRGLRLDSQRPRPKPRGSLIEIEDTDWAGADQAGRVAFTRGGRIFHRNKDGDVEIADFNPFMPDPVAAPDWAIRPLKGGAWSTPARPKPDK